MPGHASTAVTPNNVAFALDLYRALARGGDRNVAFSPWSVAGALAMTYAGARGETAREMERVLHLSSDPAQTHQAFADFADVIARIQELGQVRLDAATSIWPHAEVTLLREYRALLERYYGAAVTQVDYADRAAAERLINEWVASRTQGRITDLVSGALDRLTRLVLVTAVFFKGRWEEPFDADCTSEGRFWLGRWRSVAAPMMELWQALPYAETGDVQVLELPYAGGDLAMLILLPRSRDGLGKLEGALTPEYVASLCGGLADRLVRVQLPRFRITWTLDLQRTLAALGMRKAFDAGEADFSGMDGTKGSLVVGPVIHKAYLEVNEEGTEAAAASAVVMVTGEAPSWMEDVIPVIVDHPFVLAVRERSTGNLLFLARVVDPTESGT
jgi:serine protease inhibitor